MTEQPHDHLVRAVFGQPERAAAELRAVLPPGLVAQLDLATMQAVPATFVDPALRDRAADLLFTVRRRGGGTSLIHLLLEHQSRIDRWMPLRLLDYQRQIWERWRREHPEERKLPRIIAVVLYHGDHPWPGETRFAHLLEGVGDAKDEGLGDALDFRWWLDDLTRLSDDQLRGRALDAASLLTLLALKHARGTVDLRERVLSWST